MCGNHSPFSSAVIARSFAIRRLGAFSNCCHITTRWFDATAKIPLIRETKMHVKIRKFILDDRLHAHNYAFRHKTVRLKTK